MKILATLTMAGLASSAVAQAPQVEGAFLHEAARDHMAEIEAGELAENKGTSEAVRRYGAMMVEQHTTARDKVEALARRRNVELPTAPSDEQRETIEKLQAADGARFDQQYVAEMVKAHEKTLEMLKTEIASGRDAETKALAQELLPTVRSHLSEAYRLAGKDEQAAQLPK